jgi:hypothetical protein
VDAERGQLVEARYARSFYEVAPNMLIDNLRQNSRSFRPPGADRRAAMGSGSRGSATRSLTGLPCSATQARTGDPTHP